MKRHSSTEISSILREAALLMAKGKSQAEACKALGVSVMTYHRWRKLELDPTTPSMAADSGSNGSSRPVPSTSHQVDDDRISELRLENERLRKIVTDLLLEKLKIEEQVASRKLA